ncbi:MAG: cohesin domain-containing protein, partial [Candidatus Sumerlaeia bacterium]|nr:cohesin domain-containing protein [Candidatus Sumerlaeia bacterium]
MNRLFGVLIYIVYLTIHSLSLGLTLNVGSDYGLPGEKVEIRITLDDAVNVGNFGFTLLYDTEKLSLEKVEKGTATANWFVVNGLEILEGAVIAGYRGSGTLVNGSKQEICRIELTIESDAKPGVV